MFSFLCLKVTYLPFMSRVIIILSLLFFVSCTELNQYQQIIAATNRIEISYRDSGKTIILTEQQTVAFKNILTRDVIPKLQRKFLYDVVIDLYKDSNRIGYIRILNNPEHPFANFSSDSLGFGFDLPYGIGMFIGNLK